MIPTLTVECQELGISALDKFHILSHAALYMHVFCLTSTLTVECQELGVSGQGPHTNVIFLFLSF